MSNFTREIKNFDLLEKQLKENRFLERIEKEYIQQGKAFLAVRNNEATVYYHGNQLCSLLSRNNFLPSIYNHYLPLTRSKTLQKVLKKVNYTEMQWQEKEENCNISFHGVLLEILDNIVKEQSPESVQASEFYKFSPLNRKEQHDIVLLDIEAAFAESREKTERIDLVFYHTVEKRLMFVEVKRLWDDRLEKKDGNQAEVVEQMNRYSRRLCTEKDQINTQYNHVIGYYNKLSGKNMPLIENGEPLLGLLLVEYTSSAEDKERKQKVERLVQECEYKKYAIGNTGNLTKGTITAIYEALRK